MSGQTRMDGDRHEPGRYEIRLKGHLDTRWAAWFDGLSLTHQSDGITILHGPVADQAALHGLLQKVRDTGLPLVSVICVEPDPAAIPADEPRQSEPASSHGPSHEPVPSSSRFPASLSDERNPAMTSSRQTALVVGVLFILTFITSIAGVIAYGPVLSDHNYVTGAGADSRVFLGAFLELLLIITNIGCAVVLFPMLKRQNESLALGYVAARLVECTFILVGLISVLAVVTLRQQAAGADAGSLVTVARSLIAIHDWTFLLGPGFADGIGTGMILGWLMYRSGLVSRRMALFGVVGGPLLAASGIAVLLGVIPQFSPLQGLATVPEIVWEAFLGLWLTAKGFRPSAVAALGADPNDRVESVPAAPSPIAVATKASAA